MRQFTILVLSGVLSLWPERGNATQCSKVFNGVIRLEASTLRFSQGQIGYRWARNKWAKYEGEFANLYQPWARQDYIWAKTSESPLLAIRDHKGSVRLIDDHHKFYALSRFAKETMSDFSIFVHVVRDFTLPRIDSRESWSEVTMVTEMLRLHYLTPLSRDHAKDQILRWFPSRIEDMVDSPVRSLMGFLLKSFDVSMKGSDFLPMIQFQLAKRMVREGIEIPVDQFDDAVVINLRDQVLQSPELLRFLIDQIDTANSLRRQEKVRSYLLSNLRDAI